MYPELFELPFVHLTVKSYGLMMVIGFLSAVFIIRRLSRDITPNPQYITNAALYSLIAGVAGARLFYVVHYFEQFKGRLIEVFYIWQGGLELLGGVILAITVIFFYLWYHKLPIRYYLDILAIGLMLALVFGRIGCFLNGCCFGKPTELPWAVRFPYGSFAYCSQVQPNPARNRAEPQMKLPDDFFNLYAYPHSQAKTLKSYEELTLQQKQLLKTNDKLRCLPVHPTELYESASGAVLCLVLYLFWKSRSTPAIAGSATAGAQRAIKLKKTDNPCGSRGKPGSTFALMFIVYGITRFFIEFLRDDNPFEYGWWAIYKGATVSQNIGIYMTIFGLILMFIFQSIKTQQPK